jgi:quercetin 2,3-dioxygenase
MKTIHIEKMGFQLIVKSPFIACMHHKDLFPAGNDNMEPVHYLPGRSIGNDFNHSAPWRMYYGDKIPGFPVHPHRGFETITVVTKGFADHHDSKGSQGRYGKGDVQWMTAGAGIQHSEMFPLLNEEGNNTMELFQIWLNLPQKDKFATPAYRMMWNEKIPLLVQTNEAGKTARIKLIAGNCKGEKSLEPPPASWAADRNNHVGIWLVDMEPEATIILPPVSATLNRMIYLFEGEKLSIYEEELKKGYCAELNGNADIFIKNGKKRAHLLLLEGEPINEPVAAYGPFVMNSMPEVQQAYEDYQKSRFGGWPWDTDDPVCLKKKPRFAKHADGTIERP